MVESKQKFKEEDLLKVYPVERIHTAAPYLIEKYNALLELALSYKQELAFNQALPEENAERTFEQGDRITIQVGMIEFNAGGNTIWVQSPTGGTTMRIKTNGKINIDQCENSPISHVDIIVDSDINFCLSQDAK